MKRCTECRIDYYDDSLLYHLDDGSALLEGPARHWILFDQFRPQGDNIWTMENFE